MLNISENKISDLSQVEDYNCFELVEKKQLSLRPIYLIICMVILTIAAMFLPWTQNINARGYVSTLTPDIRPQFIQSVIAGKLEKWYVKEGDFVEKGDTIIFISEVKSDYLDPELVDRTAEQLAAKNSSIGAYQAKAKALEEQYAALEQARELKLEQNQNKIAQTKLKIQSDSMDLVALRIDNDIAQKQFDRTQQLYDKGLKSLTDLETKKQKLQQTAAKVVAQQNKLLINRNELSNLKLQRPTISSEYADKLAKSLSDKQSVLSSKYDARASTAKLSNQLSNYEKRSQFYHILAPQSGYITKTIKKGIGEVIKEGSDILTIVPEQDTLSVEAYVEPMDLPLLQAGQNTRLLFDGWPAVIFSGWPNTSYGTYAGKIMAIDRDISDNGKYRVLIRPAFDEKHQKDKPWPDLIRTGSGASVFILLNDVPLWYELWRQLNGFPADFYGSSDKKDEKVKMKAPLKKVK